MYHKVNENTKVVTQNIHHGEGEITRRKFFGGVSRLPVTMEVWELNPGVSEGGHTHGGDSSLEEIYYFTAGKGVMWCDGKDVDVQAGDAIMVPPGVNHGFRNTGTDLLKLVIIWGKPSTN